MEKQLIIQEEHPEMLEDRRRKRLKLGKERTKSKDKKDGEEEYEERRKENISRQRRNVLYKGRLLWEG